MIKSYFIVALRNLRKNKLNTVIIVLGLSTGIACGILSFLFVHHELTFDRFHENIDAIHELKMVIVLPMGRAVADPKSHMADELSQQFPEVICAVRMNRQDAIVKMKDELFEEKGLATEAGFFEMFTFPLKYGVERNALENPDSVVLSERMAKKYFGEDNPLGRTLAMRLEEGFADFVVTGVVESIPDNSSLQFDFLINLERIFGISVNDPLKSKSMGCFVQLENKISVPVLLEKFKTSIDVPLQEKYSKGSGYDLQAFAGFHLKGKYGSQILVQKSTISYSFILAGISLLVLIIACFNFMNLSIGRASSRLKEIGVRKVLGAKRRRLIEQFWFESLIHSFLSLVVGLFMAELFLPSFNRLAQKNLGLNVFSIGWTLVLCIGIVVLVGVAAGSYPALFLSKFSSVDLFRGKMRLSRKSAFSRSLVVFQFAISIFLIVSTVFMYKQKTFMLNSDMGYEPDRVVVLSLRNLETDKGKNAAFLSILKNRLLAYDLIRGVGGSAYDLSEGWMGTYFEDRNGDQKLVLYNYIDQDFIPTLGVNLIEGRNFSEEYPTDLEGSVIINQSFAEMLDVDSPLGHKLSEFFRTEFDRQIIGIVEDFHSQSLHDPIYPAFMGVSGVDYNYVFVKLKGGGLREAIALIKNEFRALAPQTPFEFSFLDEDVARLYSRETQWVLMIEYASLFAILIACSGLFGLTLQVVFLRTKEIGIRKILGASVRNILLMINRDFVRLVAMANVIAWPAAYAAMSAVLKNYAYRISLVPWVFVFSGLLALLFAAATISVQALRAATANPSETLRYE